MAQQRSIERDLVRGDTDLVAAPPDDGGHVGNFTRDAETMQVSHAEQHNRNMPETNVDPTLTGTMDRADPSAPKVGVVSGTLVVLAVVAIAVVAVLLLAGG